MDMQAGESLSFIASPDELEASVDTYSDEEREMALYLFYRIIKPLLSQIDGTVRTMDRPEQIGIVTAKESSQQILFSDGSYLHIVAHGHELDGKYLDMGLSVVEHNQEGKYLNGYIYELNGSELRYSVHRELPEGVIEDLDEGDLSYHFSLIDQYEHQDELYAAMFTDDNEVREYAQEQMTAWEEESALALAEKEVGVAWRQPSFEDIDKLSSLIKFASPFKVPEL